MQLARDRLEMDVPGPKKPCAKAPNELQGPNSVEMCAWDDLHEGSESEADVHRWHQWDRQWRLPDSLDPKPRSRARVLAEGAVSPKYKVTR